MHGHFNVGLFDAHGMSDADFMALNADLKSPGLFDKIRKDHKRLQHCEGANQIFDAQPQWLFYWAFKNAPSPDDPLQNQVDNRPTLWDYIILSTKDGDPSYLERDAHWYYQSDWNYVAYAAAPTTSGQKWFYSETIISTATYADPDGREGFYLRQQWLWLPSQGISNQIRSIIIWHSAGGTRTDYYSYRVSAARIRLKDSGGVGVTINKTTSQVLLVEYIIKLIAV